MIFPATETTRAITKLDMVEYVVKMADPLLGALRDRPTTLERWPNGVQPGMHVGRGKDAAGFYQKHLPRSVPDYVQGVEITFPSGRTAIELCPTEPAVLAWCMQMGTITFHPWPVRRTQNPDSLDKPDELRIDLDPQPGIPFGETVRVALKAGNLLNALGMTGFCKTSGGRGVHIYVPITLTGASTTYAMPRSHSAGNSSNAMTG